MPKATLTTFEDDLALEDGGVLPRARLVIATYGTLAADASNAILFPTRFGATHEANEWLIGPGLAFDPERWFIVVPNLFGNGASSSPSNTPAPYDRGCFRRVTIRDNVGFQHKAIAALFGIERFALAAGWSMGAQQAYQWAVSYPDAVARLAVICGAARTAPHNAVFLKSLEAALLADPEFEGGDYVEPPKAGLRAMGRIYAGWAYSQAWYRTGCHLEMGYADLDGYLVGYWDALFETRDANDLLAHITTWLSHDVGTTPDCDGLEDALGRITAPTLLMPGRHDLYFCPEDNAAELPHLGNGRLKEIDSIWGHMCGSGQSAEDTALISARLARFLAASE